MTRYVKIIAVLLAIILVFTIGGVAATWKFVDLSPDAAESDAIEVDFAGISWANETAQAIVELWNESTSDLEDNLQERFSGLGITSYGRHNFYGSMDPQYSSTQAETILANYNCSAFIIQAYTLSGTYTQSSSYTSAYIYTTDVYLGVSGEASTTSTYYSGLGSATNSNKTPGQPTTPIGENIYRIYRTEVKRDNGSSDWEVVETLLGYAPSCWYLETRSASICYVTEVPSFDIGNWKQGTRGYSTTTAVWTYGYNSGDTTTDTSAVTVKAYCDLYDTNADLEKKDYTDSTSFYFYYVLETAGTTYKYSYSSGVFTVSSSGSESTTYNYTATGNYTITASLSSATITVLDANNNAIYPIDENENGEIDENEKTYSLTGTGARYYIMVGSSGKTTQVDIKYVN